MQKRREWNKSIVYEGEQLIGKKTITEQRARGLTQKADLLTQIK